MLPNIVQDLLKIVGGGAVIVIVLAVMLQQINVIPTEDVMVFIVWSLGSASLGTLLGLIFYGLSNK